jgi:hypothetical protein
MIKFYSTNDLAHSNQVLLADTLIDEIDTSSTESGINEAISYFIILKYQRDYYNSRWNITSLEKVKERIANFIRGMNSSSWIDTSAEVNPQYYFEFWEFVENYQLYKKIENTAFLTIVEEKIFPIKAILANPNTVKYFQDILKVILIGSPYTAEILLEKYVSETQFDRREINLPPNLTSQEIEKCISDYVDFENAQLNYLRLIESAKSEHIIISDRTKLKTKRRIILLEKEFFENSQSVEFGITISYDSDFHEGVKVEYKDHVTTYTYDLSWIKNNLENSTVLNNFIYLFHFVDDEMRLTLVNKASETGVIEDLFGGSAKTDYKTNMHFEHKKNASNMQLSSYIQLLVSQNIYIESIISWFFQTYVSEEFGIGDFNFSCPSSDVTYLEKCRHMLVEMEGILKQYNLYVIDGEIDYELLNISSEQLDFRSCKSCVAKKYIYPNSELFANISYLLFSDQCMLHYPQNHQGNFRSFYEVLIHSEVNIADYPDYLHQQIEWLQSNGILTVSDSGQIIAKDIVFLYILFDLHQNEVIAYHNIPKQMQKRIDELIATEFLRFESSLLSIPEQDFFIYYLNRKSFGNSLDLRNKYLHGTQIFTDEEVKIHEYNYLLILKLLIVIVIKINDDLCTKIPIRKI